MSYRSRGHFLAIYYALSRSLRHIYPSLLLSQYRNAIKQMCSLGINFKFCGFLAQVTQFSTSSNYRKSTNRCGRPQSSLKYLTILYRVTDILFMEICKLLLLNPPILIIVLYMSYCSFMFLGNLGFFFNTVVGFGEASLLRSNLVRAINLIIGAGDIVTIYFFSDTSAVVALLMLFRMYLFMLLLYYFSVAMVLLLITFSLRMGERTSGSLYYSLSSKTSQNLVLNLAQEKSPNIQNYALVYEICTSCWILDLLQWMILVCHDVFAILLHGLQIVYDQLVIYQLLYFLSEFLSMSLRLLLIVFQGNSRLFSELSNCIRVYFLDRVSILIDKF